MKKKKNCDLQEILNFLIDYDNQIALENEKEFFTIVGKTT